MIRDTISKQIKNLALLDDAQIVDVERGIYNWAIEFCQKHKITRNWDNAKFKSIYIDKARSVILNLNADSYLGNTSLASRVVSGICKVRDIAFMKPAEVFPEHWKDIVDEKIRKDGKILNEAKPESMTEDFECGKCKQRRTIYFEKQTRSCDEPCTIFICCITCGHKWSVNP